VAAGAGCGGSGSSRLSKSEYEQKLKAEGAELRSVFSGVSLQGGNLKTLATQMGRLQDKIEKTANDLDQLRPPKDAEADNKKIAGALHRFADLFAKIKSAAASGNAKAVESLTRAVQAAGAIGTQATLDLKQKGYDVGVFSG
jgi:hypothetical protein